MEMLSLLVCYCSLLGTIILRMLHDMLRYLSLQDINGGRISAIQLLLHLLTSVLHLTLLDDPRCDYS